MAIVTSKFRVSAANSFAESFSSNSIYMVLARPQAWDDTLSTNFTAQAVGTVNDNNPPNPVDNYTNEFALWRDAMAGIRLSPSQVQLVTVRNNWQSGTRYDMYRHNINASDVSENGHIDLSDCNFIAYVTSTGNVYKCLYNGKNGSLTTGVVSTTVPTTTGSAPQKTADGYIWKYMYTITSAYADFVTANYIPVVDTTSVSNVNGIDVAYVTSPGTGYSGIPSIIIYGDGTGATAQAVTSAGSIARIDITNAGSGYTWAKIQITGGGTPTTANAIAVIAPTGGHGSRNASECMAHNVMVAGTVSGYEQSDFPVNQDFRTVALIKNPLQYNSAVGYFVTSNLGSIYTMNTGRIERTLCMTSSATTAPVNDTILSGALSGATGIFVFQSSNTTNLEYIQPVNSDNPGAISDLRINLSTGKLATFSNSETITGTNYSQFASSTAISSRLPEIQPYSGEMLYLDYRQPVTRSAGQNEKINIVINF